MGAATSTNIIDATIRNYINIINRTTQECSINGSNIVRITIKATGDVVLSGDINVNQVITLNTECMQNNQSQTKTESEIKFEAEQIAESVAAGLSMTRADSENLTQLFIDLGVAVNNEYYQTCATSSSNFYTLNVEAGGNVFYSGTTNINQVIEAEINCVQQSENVTEVITKIDAIISQYASSEIKGILGPLLILLIIVLAVVAMFIFGGAKALTDWKFLLTIFGIAVFGFLFYLLLAYFFSWWPFTPEPVEEKINN